MLSVESWSGQRVAEGILGCPICHARYSIREGVIDFTGNREGVTPRAGARPDAFRLAAQLSLSDPGGIVLLAGQYAAAHNELVDMAGVTCLVIDALPTTGAINLSVGERLPFVNRALRGAAIDAVRATPAFLSEVSRCVRPGGRLVAPADSLLPPRVHLVARDAHEWVAAIEDSAPTVPLRRARGSENASGG